MVNFKEKYHFQGSGGGPNFSTGVQLFPGGGGGGVQLLRAGEGISEPLSNILYNMLSGELFKHPATQIESLVLSCR